MKEPDAKGPRATSIIERIDGELHSVKTFFDEAGKTIGQSVHPLMLEFSFKDVCQILIGAAALGVPTAYTEEVWLLAEKLPTLNTIGIVVTSLGLVAVFAFFIFYHRHLRGRERDFVMRVALAYLLTFGVSAGILCLIEKFTNMSDTATALKRSALVALPGCFGATVVDSLK